MSLWGLGLLGFRVLGLLGLRVLGFRGSLWLNEG